MQNSILIETCALIGSLSLSWGGLAIASPTPFKSLDAIIQEHPDLRTVDEAVELLPAVLKANWAAASHSRGLARDFTSATDPRVISFGQDDLVLTFSNCKDADYDTTYAPCNAIEAIDYDESKNEFVLRVYSFAGPRGENKGIQKEENPKNCMACHAVNGTVIPRWEPYNFWAGVHGGVSERTGTKSDLMGYESTEYKNYMDFLNTHWDTSSQSPRTKNRYTSLSMDWTRLFDEEKAKSEGYMSIVHSKNARPSHDLTELFFERNFKRLAHKLVNRANWEKEKYLLAWWGRCFETTTPHTYIVQNWDYDFGIDELYSPGYRELKPFAELREEMEAEIRADFRSAKDKFLKESSDARYAIFAEREIIFYNQAAPMVKRLTEILDDIDYKEWNLSFKSQRHNFASPGFGLTQFQKLLREAVRQKESGLEDLSCEILKEKSRESLR